MKKIILLLMIAVISTASYSQKIDTEKTSGGYKFTQNGNKLSFSQLVDAMKNDQEAYALAKSAKSNYIASQVVGGVGGFVVGWNLGTAIGGGKPNWTIAGMGAALIIVSIPITSNSIKKMKKAVDHYNSNITSTAYHFRPTYRIVSNGNGIGLSMSF